MMAVGFVGDNNEVSDEGVPYTLPLLEVPLAIFCHLAQYVSSRRTVI